MCGTKSTFQNFGCWVTSFWSIKSTCLGGSNIFVTKYGFSAVKKRVHWYHDINAKKDNVTSYNQEIYEISWIWVFILNFLSWLYVLFDNIIFLYQEEILVDLKQIDFMSGFCLIQTDYFDMRKKYCKTVAFNRVILTYNNGNVFFIFLCL